MTVRTLERIAGELDRTVAVLAARCTVDGRLDSAIADEHQLACYEIAVTHADLLAAQACRDALSGMSALDHDLAMAFLAESCVAALGRLEAVQLGLDMDDTGLAAIRASEDVADLRKRWASPGFLGELGARVVAHDGTFGQVELDEASEMAAEAFGRFASDVVAPLAEEIHRKDLTVPETLLQPMREMGVFGLSIPEEYGGSAGERENTPMMIAVTEALSEASLAAAGSLITRPEILARALLAGGTEAQKRHWLPRIAAGDPLCAISITEPDYGSDVASLSLKGTKVEGGWLLNGAKTWCTFAGKAGVLMVVTRTDPDRSKGHRGLSVLLVEKPAFEGHEFVVDQDAGGNLKGKAIPTIGYRGMHSFDLAFEEFFVPDANVIGEEEGLGKGFYLTMAGMTGGRIQTAGRALGLMRASLNSAIVYARERKVFGQPLAQYQLTQVKLAQMAARYVACRNLAFSVGRRLDEGGGSGEASVAKLIACRSAETISREALQIHGGMGYAEEMPVSRYWIDARVLSIFEGAEETLALKVIARGLMEARLRKR
ncbi:acyl-CoA dehydrogenase family protein [Qipengyuania sphaerica]|uniref:acyl-CoA dehydrogenase family protein n=1 Tax=Qipengyuania sphaerica TaxID=2867243 RepID=UPI001C879E6D|nr:acyl-CoA dehydrogenase family protein [Qipengyuania sphaerica]MBX7540765.1 acyl-CoA dehydrogenase family protein [Qipengyuania sphaerica]